MHWKSLIVRSCATGPNTHNHIRVDAGNLLYLTDVYMGSFFPGSDVGLSIHFYFGRFFTAGSLVPSLGAP